MSNEDKMNKISKKAYLKDEKELRQVIEQMEADDLLIKTNESVVLMNDWNFVCILYINQLTLLFINYNFLS